MVKTRKLKEISKRITVIKRSSYYGTKTGINESKTVGYAK